MQSEDISRSPAQAIFDKILSYIQQDNQNGEDQSTSIVDSIHQALKKHSSLFSQNITFALRDTVVTSSLREAIFVGILKRIVHGDLQGSAHSLLKLLRIAGQCCENFAAAIVPKEGPLLANSLHMILLELSILNYGKYDSNVTILAAHRKLLFTYLGLFEKKPKMANHVWHTRFADISAIEALKSEWTEDPDIMTLINEIELKIKPLGPPSSVNSSTAPNTPSTQPSAVSKKGAAVPAVTPPESPSTRNYMIILTVAFGIVAGSIGWFFLAIQGYPLLALIAGGMLAGLLCAKMWMSSMQAPPTPLPEPTPQSGRSTEPGVIREQTVDLNNSEAPTSDHKTQEPTPAPDPSKPTPTQGAGTKAAPKPAPAPGAGTHSNSTPTPPPAGPGSAVPPASNGAAPQPSSHPKQPTPPPASTPTPPGPQDPPQESLINGVIESIKSTVEQLSPKERLILGGVCLAETLAYSYYPSCFTIAQALMLPAVLRVKENQKEYLTISLASALGIRGSLWFIGMPTFLNNLIIPSAFGVLNYTQRQQLFEGSLSFGSDLWNNKAALWSRAKGFFDRFKTGDNNTPSNVTPLREEREETVIFSRAFERRAESDTSPAPKEQSRTAI